MARRRTKNALAVLWLFAFLAFWPLGLLLLVLYAYLRWNRRCGVCKCALSGKTFDWEIEGKSILTCVECNKRMRAKVSKAAVDEVYASGSRPTPK